MVQVTVDYALCDGNGAAPVAASWLTVASNEPENGLGDGDTDDDWEVVDEHHVLLRAERSGTGTGRVYTITVNSQDNLGNVATRDVVVTVPKSQAR
jgi:hypothetical protein